MLALFEEIAQLRFFISNIKFLILLKKYLLLDNFLNLIFVFRMPDKCRLSVLTRSLSFELYLFMDNLLSYSFYHDFVFIGVFVRC